MTIQESVHDPINGHVPDGIPVKFTASNGNLSTNSVTLISGQATSISKQTISGLTWITAITDNQTLSVLLTVNLHHICT